jgi:hypothetical protein
MYLVLPEENATAPLPVRNVIVPDREPFDVACMPRYWNSLIKSDTHEVLACHEKVFPAIRNATSRCRRDAGGLAG